MVKTTVPVPAANTVVALAKLPPTPVELQVTVGVPLTVFPLESTNVTVIVAVPPAVGLEVEDVTVYAIPAPAPVVIFPVTPVRAFWSVALTVWTVAATVFVVNVTVATPSALVTLVAEEKEPPAPVLLHVTTLPAVNTKLPVPSTS